MAVTCWKSTRLGERRSYFFVNCRNGARCAFDLAAMGRNCQNCGFTPCSWMSLVPESSANPIHRLRQVLAFACLLSIFPGCLSTHQAQNQAFGPSGMQIPSQNRDIVWERAVAVLNKFHFMIARESKQEGVIETYYRAGSNLLEPWNNDSFGYANRLESTLQSIRRKVTVTFENTSGGQLNVVVLVDKEIEDVPGLAANYEGGATFSESQLLKRDLNQVLGQSGPSRWLSRGNDPALEAELMQQIRSAPL